MPWRLVIAPRAEKDMVALPRRDREAVARAIDRLATDPAAVDLKKLAGREGQWRLRVGRWRAILQLDNDSGLITVLRLLPRASAYRD